MTDSRSRYHRHEDRGRNRSRSPEIMRFSRNKSFNEPRRSTYSNGDSTSVSHNSHFSCKAQPYRSHPSNSKTSLENNLLQDNKLNDNESASTSNGTDSRHLRGTQFSNTGYNVRNKKPLSIKEKRSLLWSRKTPEDVSNSEAAVAKHTTASNTVSSSGTHLDSRASRFVKLLGHGSPKDNSEDTRLNALLSGDAANLNAVSRDLEHQFGVSTQRDLRGKAGLGSSL